MIELLLSDRADERRSLFEEAAGISLYRDRKHSQRTPARGDAAGPAAGGGPHRGGPVADPEPGAPEGARRAAREAHRGEVRAADDAGAAAPGAARCRGVGADATELRGAAGPILPARRQALAEAEQRRERRPHATGTSPRANAPRWRRDSRPSGWRWADSRATSRSRRSAWPTWRLAASGRRRASPDAGACGPGGHRARGRRWWSAAMPTPSMRASWRSSRAGPSGRNRCASGWPSSATRSGSWSRRHSGALQTMTSLESERSALDRELSGPARACAAGGGARGPCSGRSSPQQSAGA